MPFQNLTGTSLEISARPGALAPHALFLVELLEQVSDPVRSVLDRDDLELGIAPEKIVLGERAEGFHDGEIAMHEGPLESGLGAYRRIGFFAPFCAEECVVPGIANVVDDGNSRLMHARPEWVEMGIRG